jgi:hypothetical protein
VYALESIAAHAGGFAAPAHIVNPFSCNHCSSSERNRSGSMRMAARRILKLAFAAWAVRWIPESLVIARTQTQSAFKSAL